MSALISGVLKDGMGKPIPNCTIELKAERTSATVVAKTIASQKPEENGSYSMNVEAGKYSVTLCVEGYPPNHVGEIYVHRESVPGTLNYYLGLPTEGDLPPAAIQQFEEMVALVSKQAAQVEKDKAAAAQSAADALASKNAAKTSETNANNSANDAAASAQAAKISETNAANSKKSAQASAADALASQNAAKTSEIAANGSKVAAAQSAADALVSKNAAKTSETNASNSASDAAVSAQAAKASENSARSSNVAAAQSAADALASKNAAKTSENNALNSATGATASAQAAKLSETNAANSKSGAEASAASALASKNDAKASETNAAASKSAAAQSAVTAKTEADRAAIAAAGSLKKDQNLADLADKSLARANLQLGESNAATFKDLVLTSKNSVIQYSASGVIGLHNLNVDGSIALSTARIYSEIRNDNKAYTSIETRGNNKINYLIHDEDGNLSTNGQLNAGTAVSCNTLSVRTQVGTDTTITIDGAATEPQVGGWLNLLAGMGGASSFWQVGGIKSSTGDVGALRFGISNSAGGFNYAELLSSPSGSILRASRHLGSAVVGSWDIDATYVGAPFWIDVINNPGGYQPFIRGAQRNDNGYALSSSFGMIGNGNNAWASSCIKLKGDNTHNRAFYFTVMGDITTWGDGQFTGAYLFTKAPTSDAELKDNIVYNNGKDSYDKVMHFKPATFIYKADKRKRVRRGFIAQDLMQIDSEYVRLVPAAPVFDEGGERDADAQKDDTLALDSNVLLLDGLIALQYMGGIIESQKNAIASLEKKLTEMCARLEGLEKTKS
ncbi:prophage tail fiber N-terminal domain-containing protein [Hafnia paralvei]|uniref:prophage tail fiber N-terminal domain-containing protein n=1 Tax=Hafnia paralvei TaxID=546367 RepID=UPI00300D08B4